MRGKGCLLPPLLQPSPSTRFIRLLINACASDRRELSRGALLFHPILSYLPWQGPESPQILPWMQQLSHVSVNGLWMMVRFWYPPPATEGLWRNHVPLCGGICPPTRNPPCDPVSAQGPPIWCTLQGIWHLQAMEPKE